MALVTRDPFAREEIHKERVKEGECAWCGACDPGGNDNGAAVHKLYRFRVETDGGRTRVDGRVFCSKSCRESFYA